MSVMISGKMDRDWTSLWKAEHLTTFAGQMPGRCHTEIAQSLIGCNFSVARLIGFSEYAFEQQLELR